MFQKKDAAGQAHQHDNGPIQGVSWSQERTEDGDSGYLPTWRSQLLALGRVAMVVWLPCVLLLSLALLQRRVPITHLFRDLNAVADLPFYAGFYSQLGAVLWTAAAAICLFSWRVLRLAGTGRQWQHFLLAAGILTSLLLADDLFTIHEAILPRILPRAQLLMYLFYAVAGVAFVVRFRRLILKTDYLLILASLGLLAFSLTTDVWSTWFLDESDEAISGYRILVEDGAKLLGIAGWLSYFVIVSTKRLGSVYREDS